MNNRYPNSIQEIKRLKLDREKNMKIYPNLYNTNMPDGIDCDDQNNEQKLMLVFRRYCPQHFTVCKAEFEKFRTSPVCQIRVEYKAEADHLPEQGDALKTLVSLLLKHVPSNCYILDRGLIEKKKMIVIYYGLIDCKCDAPNFNMPNVKDLHIC